MHPSRRGIDVLQAFVDKHYGWLLDEKGFRIVSRDGEEPVAIIPAATMGLDCEPLHLFFSMEPGGVLLFFGSLYDPKKRNYDLGVVREALTSEQDKRDADQDGAPQLLKRRWGEVIDMFSEPQLEQKLQRLDGLAEAAERRMFGPEHFTTVEMSPETAKVLDDLARKEQEQRKKQLG